MDMKKYKAHIFGETFSLKSDEPEQLVFEAVELVDNSMKEISFQNALLDARKAAVLSALRIALRLKSLELMLEEERSQSSRILHVLERQDYRL
jgi:cell division protein ZapA (FtsZ GTPase activity inhibitor)